MRGARAFLSAILAFAASLHFGVGWSWIASVGCGAYALLALERAWVESRIARVGLESETPAN